MGEELEKLYLQRRPEGRKLRLIDKYFGGLHDSNSRVPSIVDLGAGSGLYLSWLARHGHVVAIDISLRMCQNIKAMGFAAVRARIENLPFRDGAFDACWASEVLEHTSDWDAASAAISEMERITRQVLIITMPNPWSPHYYSDPTHALRYSVPMLRKHFRSRSRQGPWSYAVRGIGLQELLSLEALRRLSVHLTWYLPELAPTIAVIGRKIKVGSLANCRGDTTSM